MKINNLTSLRRETERLEYKLKVDKSKLKTDIKLLRFNIFEYVLREVLSIFKKSPAKKVKPGPKEKKTAEKKSAKE
jgi:hypothetical protein